MSSVVGGLRWGVDRMLAVGYGVLYDYIFENFPPYRQLTSEIVGLLESTVASDLPRRDLQVLDVACGPGSMTVMLAEAGFSVTGVESYAPLVDLAREKRRARRLTNVAFRHGELARANTFKPSSFDRLVNVHSLYVHPRPDALLREAWQALKPGGLAVFVNRTRQVNDWRTVREAKMREGVRAAVRSLLWVVPNAIFEVARKRDGGPHYWDEATFRTELTTAGFTLLTMRRTFLHGSSLLAFVRKDAGE